MMNPEPLAWKNGTFLPLSECHLSVTDCGFVAGATITDYCRTYNHQLFRWHDHISRFRHDCQSIGIDVSYSNSELEEVAQTLIANQSQRLSKREEISLVTFATPGPIPYMSHNLEDSQPTIGMHVFPLPRDRYRRFYEKGVCLRWVGILPSDTNSIIPYFIKHRSRLHWHLAARMAKAYPGDVPFLTDQFGQNPDTAIGSIIAVDNGILIRPVHGHVLDSISMRVVQELCCELNLSFVERAMDFRDLPNSISEIILTGSAFGVASVREVHGPELTREFSWPGPCYQQLVAAWSRLVGVDITQQFIDSGL
jgi:branched-chain amino acid aminotransferase